MTRQRYVPAYFADETSNIVVLACGDPEQPVESLAHQACTSLSREVVEVADIRLIGDLRAEYIRDVPPGVRAVIVDAVIGRGFGEIITVPLSELSGREEPIETANAKEVPIDQVVAVGQLLRDAPVRGRFVGVVIGSAEPTSEPMADADGLVANLVEAVTAAVRQLSEA